MNVNNLRVGTRLGIAFGTILLLLVAIAYTGYSALKHANDGIDVIVQENNVEAELANELHMNLNVVANAVRNYLIYPDVEMRQLQSQRIAKAWQAFDEAMEKMAPLLRSEKANRVYAEIKAHQAKVRPMLNQVLTLSNAYRIEEATAFLRDQVQVPQDKWFVSIESMLKFLKEQNEASVMQLHAEYASARIVLIGALLAALATGIAMGWMITRSITRPLQRAVKFAETVSSGDLTSHIEANSKDETGQLLRALKNMNAALVSVVSQVRAGTDTISTASSQIASGNQDLSSRTEQQASSLEETASSMEELTSTVKQNADNARQANQLAVSASEVAEKGGVVVEQVVHTMSEINQSARKIADIIGVIDGIAFQTNILALNAAVEAARAGEQGRGFAVVATEVRSLAQRSAAAAKEIKTLIEDSVGKVDAGSRLVGQAGATMDEIVGSVRRVTDVMVEIMAASQEQSAGIEQVSQAIGQMDQVTQQNAALVEQAAAAAESMQDQAAVLARLVATFKLQQAARTEAPVEKAAAQPEHRPQPVSKSKPIAALPSVSAPRKTTGAAAGSEEWEEF